MGKIRYYFITEFFSIVDQPLTISIPEAEILPCNIPVPHLTPVISETRNLNECIKGSEECEHNSIEDTASVASDLTRMYVSDEEKETSLI